MNLNYNTDNSKKEIKKEINLFFAKETAKRKNLGCILFLESRALATIKALIKYKVKRKNFLIPSPLQEDYSKISKYIKDTENCMLDEWLKERKVRPPKIASAWFDYMCSIKGNGDIQPCKDIETYFMYKFPVDNSLFGYTLCVRHPKVTYERENIDKTEEFVQVAAARGGYMLIKSGRCYGYNGMFTQFWRVINIGKEIKIA